MRQTLGAGAFGSDLTDRLRDELRGAGFDVRVDEASDAKLVELRAMYEPFVAALSDFLLLSVPPIRVDERKVDNWQTSAWMRRARGLLDLTASDSLDDHRDA